MTPGSRYTAVNVNGKAMAALRRLQALLTGRAGRRLSYSETIETAEKLIVEGGEQNDRATQD